MTAIVDYGVGNLFSLYSSLRAVGAQAAVTGDAAEISKAERVILPGVGAFGDAAAKLREKGLDEAVLREAQRGKPILGICLGMQLLFERSFEFGEHEGLGLIPGSIVPMAGRLPAGLKIPQIGWNALNFSSPRHPIFGGLSQGEHVYFVHSYFAADCDEYVTAWTEYGIPMTAAAAKGNVCGCQFHPEKSGAAGLSILRKFCEMR